LLYNEIGISYFKLDNFENSENYFTFAIDFLKNKKTEDKFTMDIIYNNRSFSRYYNFNFISALDDFNIFFDNFETKNKKQIKTYHFLKDRFYIKNDLHLNFDFIPILFDDKFFTKFIFEKILSFLNFYDILNLKLISKEWNSLICENKKFIFIW
jgi:hypothetical protein